MSKLIFACACVVAVGCGRDPKKQHDAGVQDAGGLDASCFENPQSHYEIINACTTAQKVYKESNPPLLGDDGSLPALPAP